MPFEFDESQWPIAILRAIGEATTDDVDKYLEIQDRLIGQKQPHVLIWDSRQAKLIKPLQRRRLATWISEHEAELKKYRLGFAFI